MGGKVFCQQTNLLDGYLSTFDNKYPWWLGSEESTCNSGDMETQIRSLGQEGALEEGMVTHSSILTWRISWTEEPAGLQSMES